MIVSGGDTRPRPGNGQQRIPVAVRIHDCVVGVRVGLPFAIDNKAVFVGAWSQGQIASPLAVRLLRHFAGRRLPIIKSASHGYMPCSRIEKLKMHCLSR